MDRKLFVWVTAAVLVLVAVLLVEGVFQPPRPTSLFPEPSRREHPSTPTSATRPSEGTFLAPIEEVYRALRERFYDPQRVQTAALRTRAIEGMIEALDDPYSRYNTRREFEHFSEGLEGEYEGIGAWIGMRDGRLTIISPIKGGPAKAAGARAGDALLEIDGEGTEGFSVDEAARRLRGAKGTEVTVKVRHTDGVVEVLTIVRDRIKVPSVEWELQAPTIGYIRITRFASSTPQELNAALAQLRQESDSIEGLILDLRGNGGGYLLAAQQVASAFVERGQTVLIERRRGDREDVLRSLGNSLPNWPLAVLVDGGTASAAEIVAGAIRDNEMGVLIGQNTFGKGVVQTAFELSDGSRLILTTAEYFTPDGHKVHEVGLSPAPPFVVEEWFLTLSNVRKEVEALESSLPTFAEAARAVLQGVDEQLNDVERHAIDDEYEKALQALDELDRRLQTSPERLLQDAGASPDDAEAVLIPPLLAELKQGIDPLLAELRARLERNAIAVALDWLRSPQIRGQLCPCAFLPQTPSTPSP